MWKTYRDNAIENLESARLLLAQGHYTTSYECSFFAMEIVFKAWIVQREAPALDQAKYPRFQGDPFFSHKFGVLFDNWPELEQALQSGCPVEYNLLVQAMRQQRHWQPWKRYRYRANEKAARQQLNLAEGLQKWMLRALERR